MRYYIFGVSYYCIAYTTNPYLAFNFLKHSEYMTSSIFDGSSDEFDKFIEDGYGIRIGYDYKLKIGTTKGLIPITTIYNDHIIEDAIYETNVMETLTYKIIWMLCRLHKLSKYIKYDGFKELIEFIFNKYGRLMIASYLYMHEVDVEPLCQLHALVYNRQLPNIDEEILNEEEINNEIIKSLRLD